MVSEDKSDLRNLEIMYEMVPSQSQISAKIQTTPDAAPLGSLGAKGGFQRNLAGFLFLKHLKTAMVNNSAVP
jgi:hypothetical protein